MVNVETFCKKKKLRKSFVLVEKKEYIVYRARDFVGYRDSRCSSTQLKESYNLNLVLLCRNKFATQFVIKHDRISVRD